MGSEYHLSRQTDWINRIIAESTNPHAIILVLWNNDYQNPHLRYRVQKITQAIMDQHSCDCLDCTDVKHCSKFLFAECNVQTGSGIQKGVQRLGQALFSRKRTFLKYQNARMGSRSEFSDDPQDEDWDWTLLDGEQ